MCGIAGVAAVSGAAILATGATGVGTLTDRLVHRGPEATGQRLFDRCALGHTRLRIIDLSPRGDQPLPNEDETVWTVFNGEIYNFRQLRSALEAAGHSFRSETDTEVLVHLYEEHGDDLARHLHGMFAFAIWDDRRKQLLLCRDRLGIKPLYYRMDGQQLSFASEVQALAETGESIDVAALHGFLRLGWVPGWRTIRTGVSEILPGHVLVWKGGQARSVPYWSPAASSPRPTPPTTEELGSVLIDAINSHLVADVAIGLFLSSGIDSVVLARLASRVAPGLRTYTVAFDTGGDESGEASALAAGFGLDHAVVPVGETDALASVGKFIDDMDQPTVDGLNSWIISRAVRDAGAVVALSGLGGDELFCGYSTFRHVPRLARAAHTAHPVSWGARRTVAAMGRSSRTAHSRAQRAIEAMGGGWPEAYASVRGLFGAAELRRLWPVEPHAGSALVQSPANVPQLSTAMVGQMEMTNYLPFQLLRDTDCMSMAHALEARVPLLDDAVVEVALRGQSSIATWDKSRLLAAVDPDLAYLAGRPKRTFTLPIDRWMRGGLREVSEDAVVSLGEAGLGFDRRELTNLWHGYLEGRVGWRSAWALAVLGMWLDRHRSGSVTTLPHAPVRD